DFFVSAQMNQELLEYLFTMISENRKELFLETVEKRTKKIAVVLEDIYQSHNAAAVLRSCDCFGIQDVHIIENRNQWNPHPDIEQGSSKWLSISRYNEKDQNTALCLNSLKEKGYLVAATTPHTDLSIDDIQTDKPIALVFGTEMQGISEVVKSNADEMVRIPMYGFTESFNISVAAAISLHSLRSKFIRDKRDLSLTEEEQIEVLLTWCKSSINRSDKIVEDFYQRKGAN
ncbi:MAG: RNA methyltransferase, partial [Bacteroidota bacterium]